MIPCARKPSDTSLISTNLHNSTASSCRIKGRFEPLHLVCVDHQHIKTARRWAAQPQQVMARRKHNAPLFGQADACRPTAVCRASAFTYLYEDKGSIRVAHNQINLAAAASRRSIIALQQAHTLRNQKMQGLILGRVPDCFGRRRGRLHTGPFDRKGSHVSAHFSLALAAAQAAAAGQHYPQGALYIVATPIGNLADISLRALHVLQLVDTVACEDTRHTQSLLRAYGIEAPSSRLLAVHEHNETSAAALVVQRLHSGQRVAYVSDAGTPGVSDPGTRLVAAAHAAGLRVVPLPGASSPVAILSIAGYANPAGSEGGFVFKGFLSSKATERDREIQAIAHETRPVVVLEAPHRMLALAQALYVLQDRSVTVGRELTKQFEEIATQPAKNLASWLSADPNRLRGEFALVLHPAPKPVVRSAGEQTLRVLMDHLPLKTAVAVAAELTGEPRNALYSVALGLRPSTNPD